ncbi:fluoroacetyl-CoA thioesterase [Kibdelosporangium banguiense]|uniref:Fluoroacetyl-CoA thioesterase n=1 Tax=Kibdelosporangium banguiense TaxID=1365924 RepID=A0ABS4TUZ5_9PSEU|nr:thioesterase family protein [Kibdelosporangium banguiense]MBP2327758.1 fluoroacetyl-CoA thioesterase [Kibdelosporangium banguiense]
MRDTLAPGLHATFDYPVPAERTVPHLLPEAAEFAAMPYVLATGYLVGLVEWTCMRALADHLEPTERTLGVHVDLSHEAPTPPDHIVTIDVELTRMEGRILTFEVTARDEAAVVCRGTHRRAVIDLDRFERKLSARQ